MKLSSVVQVSRFLKILSIIVFFISSAQAQVPQKTDVLIIGAGLSGLATAYQLKKANITYHLVEITPVIGGRVRTAQYERNGKPTLHADSGMEEYWESNPAVKILKELKLPLKVESSASSMVLKGKLETLREGENLITYLKRIFSKEEFAAFESFQKTITPLVHQVETQHPIPAELMKLKDLAFSDWIAQHQLPPRVSDWIRISMECEIGTQWNLISALDGIAEYHIFLGQGEASYRVLGGNERFVQAMARSVGLKQISLNERVTRIETKKDRVLVSVFNQMNHENRQIEAKSVVSTIPLYRLSELQFIPPLSDKKWQAIRSQTWGSYFKAHVFVPRTAEKLYASALGDSLPILSDSRLGVIYEGNPDQQVDTKIISLLITGSFAEAFTMMPLDEVRKQVSEEFDHLWPGFSRQIDRMEFYRYHPRAIAGWPVGRSRFDDLSEAIRTPENLVYLAGDFTEGTHSSGAFQSATRVAGQIIQKFKKKGKDRT